MFEFNVTSFVITGLIAFIVGQWWGARELKKKADMAFTVMKRGFEGYQQAMGHVLKRDHNLDIKVVDAAAMQYATEHTINKFKTFIEQQAKDIQDASKSNEGNGDAS